MEQESMQIEFASRAGRTAAQPEGLRSPQHGEVLVILPVAPALASCEPYTALPVFGMNEHVDITQHPHLSTRGIRCQARRALHEHHAQTFRAHRSEQRPYDA